MLAQSHLSNYTPYTLSLTKLTRTKLYINIQTC